MPKTVKVRIAVAVYNGGSWRAAGESGVSDMTMLHHASAVHGECKLHWVEAELPVPDFPTVQGTVEKAEGE